MARFKEATVQEDGSRIPKEPEQTATSNFVASGPTVRVVYRPPDLDSGESRSTLITNPSDGSITTSLDGTLFSHSTQSSSSGRKIRRSSLGRMFGMRNYGTGLPNDEVFEYRTRTTHLRMTTVQKATKTFQVERVEGVTCSDHGVTCHVTLAKSAEGSKQKIEHFDLWFCENGPEAMTRFIETTREGARLTKDWKFRPFLEALRSYMDGDFQVVPSTEKLGEFIVQAN